MTARKPHGRRTAHGTAAQLGRLVVSECPPLDELRPGSGSDPARRDRTPDGRFATGNSLARTAKVRAGAHGALASLEAKADPAWRAARAFGRRAAAHRIREYGVSHGHDLSSGVCRLLADAAEQSADANYLSARAAANDEPDLLRIAAQLRAGARQAERDAWALADLEARSRPKADPLAWLTRPLPPKPAAPAPTDKEPDGNTAL